MTAPAPDGVLGRIVARTRADVAARRAARPLADLQAAARPTDRSLRAALTRGPVGLVCECKKASPSQGLLDPGFDPVALARGYAGVADAVSVVTDGPFFQGERAWLAAVREVFPGPVLCKDFVVDPWQVWEARALGADAVLLMLSVLDDDGWRACMAACRALGMDPLTEVHDEAELARALALGAPVLGINNRDLRSLAVDLAVTERLAPRVPPDRVLVSESGLAGHGDLLRLRPHVDAFLVGTSLVRGARAGLDGATGDAAGSGPEARPPAEARARAAGEAARLLAYGRVKVCGLTTPEDARAAWDAGATWGGLVLAPSPRRVDLAQAAAVHAGAPLRWAGVFVDAPPDDVARAAHDLALDAVQLHGAEDRAYVAALRPRLPAGCAVWRAVGLPPATDAGAAPSAGALPRAEDLGADRLVLDARAPAGAPRGGTGRRFDWALARAHPARADLLVAGGITPETAPEADALGAWALDVSSGVEAAPGRKDPARLAALFAALRGRGRRG